MNSTALRSRALPAIIAILALADGVLHLSLDFVLFRGNLFGRLGPPPGAAPPPAANAPPPSLPLPLNQLFVLNFVGYVVLALLVWFGITRLGGWRWLIDVLVLLFVGLTVAGWLAVRAPNPMGLGYLARGIELVLVCAVLVHLWSLLSSSRRRPLVTSPAG